MGHVSRQGVSKTTLREVAATCGVSLGLVQHYFGTKAALVNAIDDYVLERLADVIDTGPTSMQDGMLSKLAQLLARRPEVMDYLARALCDGEPIGAAVFDQLVVVCTPQTPPRTRTEPEPGTDCADPVWLTLHPLILVLGAIMFRAHIERHLEGRLYDPNQLARWRDAAMSLLRDGYFRRELDYG